MTGEEIRLDSLVNRTNINYNFPSGRRVDTNQLEIGNELINNTRTVEMGRRMGISDAGLKSLGLRTELTSKEKEARQKLDKQQSSTGVTYKDAKDALAKIKNKYEKDKQYWSTFESKQPRNVMIHIMPYQALDPYKIPEPDRSAFFEALEAVMEIEQNNSALFKQTGLTPTEKTPTPFQRSNIQLF